MSRTYIIRPTVEHEKREGTDLLQDAVGQER